MLRRMKTEVVTLPGKERTIVKLDPPKTFVREFTEIVNNEGLMAIQKFVQMITVSERHKIPFVVDALQSMGEQDKAIVFCNRLESVNTIVREMENAGIGCVRYTGKEVENRDEAVRLFQKDPDTRVFVSTFGAGGVGITLTSGNIVIHAGLPMTPAHLDQAEDRANRIGQKRRVRVFVPALKGSIDEGLLALLDEKRERIGEVMGEKEWEGSVRQFVQETVRNRTKSGKGEKTG
jgi:SNF2 family DNA or RNA helicase